MKVISDHINSLIQSIKMLASGKFLLYFVPGILVSFAFFLVFTLLHLLFNFLSLAEEIPYIGSYVNSGVTTANTWMEVGLIFLLQFFILTLLSPFNTLLSEKVENHITGSSFKSGFKQIVKDILRMMNIFLIGLVVDIFLFILWDLTLGNLFNLDAITPYYLMLINSFWFGFAFYDFSLERHKISSKRSYSFALKNFSYMILTGAIFTLSFQLPFFGIAIGSVLITMVSTLNFIAIKARKEL